MSHEAKLVCPHCGCDIFRRRAEDEVHIIDEGESIRDDLLGSCEEYSYSCVSCGKEVGEEELVRTNRVSDSVVIPQTESRRTLGGQG